MFLLARKTCKVQSVFYTYKMVILLFSKVYGEILTQSYRAMYRYQDDREIY